MAYTRVNRLPYRYKIVFRHDVTGERRRFMITKEEFERKDFQTYIPETYGPGRGWHWWPVQDIETFDTPSGDLEPGSIYEGVCTRMDPETEELVEVTRVMWSDALGQFNEAKPEDVTLTRHGETVEKIERKPRGAR